MADTRCGQPPIKLNSVIAGNTKIRIHTPFSQLGNQRFSDTYHVIFNPSVFACLMIRSQPVLKCAASTVSAMRTQLSGLSPKDALGMAATPPCSSKCNA